jgi:anti-sigma regulatory factor (Ser/Thr protein kinase)
MSADRVEAPLAHALLTYRTTAELVDAAAPFLAAGVEAGERVLAVLERPKARAVAEALDGRAEGVGFVEPGDWYRSPGLAVDGLHRRLGDAGAPMRAIGELRWNGGTAAERREWCRYEALLNLAFAGAGARVVCSYDLTEVPDEALASALATHPCTLGSEGVRPNPGYRDPAEVSRRLDVPLDPPPPGHLALEFGDQPAGARRMVAAECRRCGLSAQRTDDVVLAAHELVTNAIRHGGGGGVLRIWSEDGTVVCQIEDRGAGIPDPLQGFLPPPDPGGGGGWGLWLARHLADLVEVRTGAGGSTVRLRARP